MPITLSTDRTETALIYDAVHLFAMALHVLDTSQQIDVKPLSCDSTDTWDHGYSLINYMKNELNRLKSKEIENSIEH
uniref:Receptor ligand binding region domain-containing protein n=1 Tax=Trichogramma kaykai TaxID=54128 RepID=A0ABD2XSJ0_9HYME